MNAKGSHQELKRSSKRFRAGGMISLTSRTPPSSSESRGSFKANEDAECLVLPSSMSPEERRLVHIFAAREGLGHRSVHSGPKRRCLMLKKDEAWVARRKRRYLEAERSAEPEAEVRERASGRPDGPMKYSWLVALTAYYAFV